jgi:hypothetical protein
MAFGLILERLTSVALFPHAQHQTETVQPPKNHFPYEFCHATIAFQRTIDRLAADS